MKKTRFSPGIAVLTMAVLHLLPLTTGLAADSSRFAGTVWVSISKINGSHGAIATLTFGADGTWVEDYAPHPLSGHWQANGDSAAEVTLSDGDIAGHKTVHFKMSDDGTKCWREEASVTYGIKGQPPGHANPPVASSTQQISVPTEASPPISPEMQQKATDLVKAYHNSLVFVTGKEGAGSGFIATLGKSNFLISNAHVAAGIKNAAFKTLDDAAVPGGAASIAVGRDIFCMAEPAGGTPLEIMQDVGSNAAIGDDVVVLGNAEGEGVVNTISGKIVGIGADRVEIDAPFVPGNSGSPIIQLKSGKVIGVATYLVINNYDAATNEPSARPTIRRFGFRLDNIKAWQAVDWRVFYAQADEMQNIDTLTADLFDLFSDMQEHKGRITPGRHTNPVIKNRIDQWMADRTTRRSAEDTNMANANFFSFLKVACQADVTAAKQHITYDNFKSELAEEQEARDAMTKAFEGIINNLRD